MTARARCILGTFTSTGTPTTASCAFPAGRRANVGGLRRGVPQTFLKRSSNSFEKHRVVLTICRRRLESGTCG